MIKRGNLFYSTKEIFETAESLLESEETNIAEGTVWKAEKDGFSYREAAANSTDHHITTRGGVKLYVLPGQNGFDVKAFGAKGDGVTNDTLAFSRAMKVLSSIPTAKKLIAKGRYLIDLEVVWNVSDNTTLDWEGATFIPAQDDNTKKHITLMGKRVGSPDKPGSVWPPVVKTQLTKDAHRWDTSIEVEDASGIQEHDLIVLNSKEFFIKSTGERDTQEAARVSSVVGNTIYLDAPILCDYIAAEHQANGGIGFPDIWHYSTAQKVEVIGGTWEAHNKTSRCFEVNEINLGIFRKQRFIQPFRRGMEIRYCSGDTHYDQVFERMGEDPVDDSQFYPSFGYGLMHTFCCYSRVFAGQGRRGWHSFDATAGQRDITYYNFVGQMETQSISSHADAVLFRLEGCQIDSIYSVHGRGRYVHVDNCRITTVDGGIGVEWGGQSWELHVNNCEFEGVYNNAYAINSRAWVRSDNQTLRNNSRVFITNNVFRGIGGNISVEKGAKHVVFSNNTIECEGYETTVTKVVLYILDGGTGVFKDNTFINPPGGGRACVSLKGDSGSRWSIAKNNVSGNVSHPTPGYIISVDGDGLIVSITGNDVLIDDMSSFINTSSNIIFKNISGNTISVDRGTNYLIRQSGSKSSTVDNLTNNSCSFSSTNKTLLLSGGTVSINKDINNTFSDT